MFEGRFIRLVGLLKLELPGTTVRLCDGGFCDFAGERYTARHPTFGTIAAIEPIGEGVGDEAPGGKIAFLPGTGANPATLSSAAYQNARIRGWLGELAAGGKTVTATRPLFDGLVDTTVLTLGRAIWLLELVFMSRAERLFAINEGNTASSRFHQSVWPGELGFDNCTDTPVAVAWGIEGASGGVVTGGNRAGGSGMFGELFGTIAK